MRKFSCPSWRQVEPLVASKAGAATKLGQIVCFKDLIHPAVEAITIDTGTHCCCQFLGDVPIPPLHQAEQRADLGRAFPLGEEFVDDGRFGG